MCQSPEAVLGVFDFLYDMKYNEVSSSLRVYKFERRVNMGNKYYMIKIKTNNEHKVWVGWSNSGFTNGFYITNKLQCKVFSSEILDESIALKFYLLDKKYELIPVVDIESIRKSRIYFE